MASPLQQRPAFATGRRLSIGSMSLGHVMTEYLKHRALHQGSSAGSVDQYERTYRSFLGAVEVDSPLAFTPQAVNAWAMDELGRGVGGRTVSSRLAHLVALGDYLCKHGVLPSNPAREVERPRFHKPETKFLHPDELRSFLAVPAQGYESIARDVLLDTMCRVSEVANASLGDLEQVGDRVQLRVVVKGGKQKRVPLSPEVAGQLMAYLDSRGPLGASAPLIANSRGGRWTRSGLSQMMVRLGARAGVTRFSVSAHKLRHTSATVALSAGVSLKAVSALLNHSKIETTAQYLHLIPGALDQARDQQRAGLKAYLG